MFDLMEFGIYPSLEVVFLHTLTHTHSKRFLDHFSLLFVRSNDLRDFLKQCVERDVEKRPTARELLSVLSLSLSLSSLIYLSLSFFLIISLSLPNLSTQTHSLVLTLSLFPLSASAPLP